MQIMTSEEWKRRTYSRFSQRSRNLQAVDTALGQLHALDRALRAGAVSPAMRRKQIDLYVAAVSEALGVWMRDRNDYRSSTRNSGGAVEALIAQLNRHAQHTPNMRAAIQQVKQQRDLDLNALFRGCALESRSLRRHGNRQEYQRNATTSYTVGNAGRQIKALIEGLIDDSFGQPSDSLPPEVLMGVLGETVDELARQFAEALPLVGTIGSFTTAVYHTGKVCKAEYERQRLIDMSARLPVGNARASLRAMDVLLARSRDASARAAVRSTANAGAGLANILTMGAASGASAGTSLATAILALIDLIYRLGRDYLEAKAARAFMGSGRLDRNSFAQFPLLGAYYMTEAPTSSTALFFVEIGGPAWMDDVEQFSKHHLGPVQEKARSLIKASHYIITSPHGALRGNLKAS